MSFSITIKDERGPCFQPSWRFDFKEPLLIEQYTLHHSPSGPPQIIKLNNSIPSHIMDILKLLDNSCIGWTPFYNIIQSSQTSVPQGLLQNKITELTELIKIKNKIINEKNEKIRQLENENKEKNKQICELENDLIYFVRKSNYKQNKCVEQDEED